MNFFPVAPPVFDEPRLQALLDMAGPEVARELGRRLLADLAGVARALSAPDATGDRRLLRAQSHILIALAGTIGADSLAADARGLNSLAHQGLAADLARQTARLCQDLDRLITRLEPWLRAVLGPP